MTKPKIEMTVKEIVKKYLTENKYEGLVNEGSDCGCGLEDIMACESEWIYQCEAGYKCPCDCGDHDYHITTAKFGTNERGEINRE